MAERHFLNVGQAVHARTIARCLDEHDITDRVRTDVPLPPTFSGPGAPG